MENAKKILMIAAISIALFMSTIGVLIRCIPDEHEKLPQPTKEEGITTLDKSQTF